MKALFMRIYTPPVGGTVVTVSEHGGASHVLPR